MKKVILSIAVVSAFSFASCKKDKTCSCTSSTTDSGTNYDYIMSSTSPTTYTPVQTAYSTTAAGPSSETKYTKVTKKDINANCAATATSTSPYDKTQNSGHTTVSGTKIIIGDKGTLVTTTTCTIK